MHFCGLAHQVVCSKCKTVVTQVHGNLAIDTAVPGKTILDTAIRILSGLYAVKLLSGFGYYIA